MGKCLVLKYSKATLGSLEAESSLIWTAYLWVSSRKGKRRGRLTLWLTKRIRSQSRQIHTFFPSFCGKQRLKLISWFPALSQLYLHIRVKQSLVQFCFSPSTHAVREWPPPASLLTLPETSPSPTKAYQTGGKACSPPWYPVRTLTGPWRPCFFPCWC